MDIIAANSRSAWQVKDLNSDLSWRFALSETAGKDLAEMVKSVFVSGKHLFEYEYADFDFSSSWPIISAAVNEAHHGRGIALMSGLPRDALSEAQFELLSWAMGLHIGVARPQTRRLDGGGNGIWHRDRRLLCRGGSPAWRGFAPVPPRCTRHVPVRVGS